MKKSELRMTPEGVHLFYKYIQNKHSELENLSFLSVKTTDNNVVDLQRISELNELLRRASMTLEYVMANEVTEVEVEQEDLSDI